MKGLVFSLLLLALPVFAASQNSFEDTVQPFLNKNCIVCHNAKAETGGLNLSQFRTAADVDSHRDLWERIVTRVKNGEMPPKGMARPTAEQVQTLATWVDQEWARLDRNQKPDPGRVTARRLNRYEYNNTIRDLLAVNFQPAKDFPADDSGYGFDNNGDVLSLSPVLMEKYLAAAEKIANAVIPSGALPSATFERHKRAPDPHPLPDSYTVTHSFPAEGDYTMDVNVSGKHDPMLLTLYLDGRPVGPASRLATDRDKARLVEFNVHAPYGEHELKAEIVFDPSRAVDQAAYEAEAAKRGKETPASVTYIEVRGPYNPLPPPPPEGYKRLFICGHAKGHHNSECARIDLASFARLAYRRPVSEAEVEKLVRFVKLAEEKGDSFEQGMRVALEAVLVSPRFLYRIEQDPDPSNPNAIHALDDYELASRLSYFLWSSMPDAELFHLADQGQLHHPEVLEGQVKRMLADSKSKALVQNFAGQWLELRNLNSVKPDPDKFPQFEALRYDMRHETELFFQSVMRENRSILDFIDGPYTFLNARLAKFYGIPGVEGSMFQRVDLTGNPERSGVITQASVLTVSSYANRTSPVIRGKYVLENILNDPPPPPPPGVPSLDESAVGLVQSMRKQLEAHRANPTCASCHSRMDPLGFGLENYNAIGQWRTMDGKFPIDSTGVLPSGKSFSTPAQMKEILKSNSMAFTNCLAEKLLIYGLGRGLERYDKPAVEQISKDVAANGYRFDTLILDVVKSMPFEMRRGDASTSKPPATLTQVSPPKQP